jgi:aryl carrier-like protein
VVLQLAGVAPDDNLFEFGAHSFLMVKLKERLDTAFGRDIQLLEMFRHPTVNALTRLLDEVAKPDVAVASSIARARVRKELRQRRQHTFQ